MINFGSLLDGIELQIEIIELREIGLTEEEIFGYIDFYYESLVGFNDILILN